MFPFVTSVEELRQARALLAEVATEIGHRGVPVGAMVEVPSAALAADLLAREAEFFTIGTNDLIQYTLAVDRNDERVSDLYEPLHPAVIRLLRFVRRAATRAHIDASVCGEMASDPALIGLLIGLGYTAFSMTVVGAAHRPADDQRTGRRRRPAHGSRSAHAVDCGRSRAAAVRRAGRRQSRPAGPPLTTACHNGTGEDTSMIETLKRVEKPWGYELWWARTDRYVGKVIHVNKGHALSLQYHNRKDETIFVWAGQDPVRAQGGRRAGSARAACPATPCTSRRRPCTA